MSTRKPSYTPAPEVPTRMMPRLVAILEVLAGVKSVSEAARTLGLSRNHFQTILHRGVLGLVQAITVKTGGRPRKPSQLTGLQTELLRLERENKRLRKRVESTDRLLQVAGQLLHGRLRPTGRQRRSRKSRGGIGDRAEEPEPARKRRDTLAAVTELRRMGLNAAQGAAIAGVDPATLRRWHARADRLPVVARRAQHPARTIPPAAVTQAEDLIRRLHGLIGADALRHSVEGLSRRAAAYVKACTLRALERERKSSLARVTVSQPGVLRGLDAMHLNTPEGRYFALISADGSVPYRTAFTSGPSYDAALVERAVRRDFERNGAPLILRLDRAKAHNTPGVAAILRNNAVLALHGPPSYPCFYGQLERQNREHRAWLVPLGKLPRLDIDPCLEDMIEALNELWPRRSLGWKTAAQCWNARASLSIDRHAFQKEVQQRAIKIARRIPESRQPNDLAERLAIEQTLERFGYLRQEIGGWC
jgi:molybdenum-dependent DNA-binding transcriptional regulator ModE